MTRLLIIKPSSLGDIVHGLQVATSLRVQRPDLQISWIARDIFAPLVQACADIERTYVFQRHGGWGGLNALLREVRATRFDYVFDFQGLLRSGWMTWRARTGRRVGRSDAREGASLFYDQRVPLPAAGPHSHALEILLQFCPVLGARPELAGSLTWKAEAPPRPLFPEAPSGVAPVLLFPDSRREEKRWPGFAALTEAILQEDGRTVVWAGSTPAATPDWPATRFLNLTGKTPLAALPGLIRQAGWVIANDSGPMHLAAALGVPTLALFGPTDPRQYGPYPLTAPTHHVMQAPAGALARLSAREVYERWQGLSTSLRGRG